MSSFTLFLIALYFLPAVVAAARHHPNQNSIFILNLFLGWTILGWIVALVWSCSFIAQQDRVSPLQLNRDKRDPRWADLHSTPEGRAE